MLKDQRLETIKSILDSHGIVEVAHLTEKLGVTEMTVRRDLKYLEEEGILQRIHGGAKLPESLALKELSHDEKQMINIDEKIQIAKHICNLIEDEDTIFLGPGTTLELVYDYLTVLPMRVVTNSIHVFNKFKQNSMYDLILIGGSYRPRTGAFVGSIANQALSQLRVRKCFIGVNGINANHLYTANEEEGTTQSIILDNAQERFVVADFSKIHKEDFFSFYNLDEASAVITDDRLTPDKKKDLEKYTRVIN